MAIYGYGLQVKIRKSATNGLEILAKLSPIREECRDTESKKFANDHIGEIICYLDHYTSFDAENIRFILRAKDGRLIWKSHFKAQKLKKMRESTQTLIEFESGQTLI